MGSVRRLACARIRGFYFIHFPSFFASGSAVLLSLFMINSAASNSSLKMGKDKKAPLVTDESKASRTATSSTTAIVTSSSTTDSAGSGGATGLAGARNASWGFLGDLANKGNSAQHRDLNVWMPGQY